MIGEEWRDLFSIALTRDNTPYVKPDKRSLLHFAKVGGWAVVVVRLASWLAGWLAGWLVGVRHVRPELPCVAVSVS